MKASILVALVVIVAGTSEAFDTAAIIHAKTHIGNYLVNKASAALQVKGNLIVSGTKAVLNAKQDFLQRQIPHLVAFKANKINSVIKLKKNLFSATAAQLGQIHISPGGGDDSSKESLEEVGGPYNPPAAPAPSYGPPAAPVPSHGPPAAPVPTYGLSVGPSPSNGPEVQVPSNGPPPSQSVQPTPYVKPASSPPPPPPCRSCGQSSSSPIEFSPYRPGAHVQLAPPARPQGNYGPPQRPQTTYGPPAQLPQSYGPPRNHKPASIYGSPARH